MEKQRKAPKRRSMSSRKDRLLTNRHSNAIMKQRRTEEEERKDFVSKEIFGKKQKLVVKFKIPKKQYQDSTQSTQPGPFWN